MMTKAKGLIWLDSASSSFSSYYCLYRGVGPIIYNYYQAYGATFLLIRECVRLSHHAAHVYTGSVK